MPDKSGKKRILFVVYELPPIGGGVANAAFHLLKEFAKEKNLIIDVVTSAVDNRFSNKAFSPNIQLYYVPIGHKSPSKYQSQSGKEMLLFLFNSFRQISQLIFQNNYNLAHYFGYPGAFVGLFYAWKLAYIVSLRGVDVPGYNQRFGWHYRFYRPLAKLSWQFAKKLTAPSRYLADMAQQILNKPVEIISNGVDTELFKPLPESKKHRKFTVTAGGTIMGKKKGLDLLIKGFAEFNSNYADSQLILFGEGDELENLRRLVKKLNLTKNVKFVGRVSQQELAQQLPKCHIFCLPSYAEGMSNAMIEAQAAGLAIVTTTVGNGAELIKTRIALPINHDESSISQTLEKIYSQPTLREQLCMKALEFALQNGWSRKTSQYLSLYERDKA